MGCRNWRGSCLKSFPGKGYTDVMRLYPDISDNHQAEGISSSSGRLSIFLTGVYAGLSLLVLPLGLLRR